MQTYEDSLKSYRDMKNSLDTAREEGMEKGREEGIKQKAVEVVRKALNKGMSVDDIIDLTGLSSATEFARAVVISYNGAIQRNDDAWRTSRATVANGTFCALDSAKTTLYINDSVVLKVNQNITIRYFQ